MEKNDLKISAKRGNRPVWVVNDFDYDRHPEMEGVPYQEEFRGEMVTIPPRGKVKMASLAAERFLGQATTPSNLLQLPNGQYTGIPKALKKVDFTDKELSQVGLSKKELQEQDQKDADKVKRTCVVCDSQFGTEKGLKMHMTKAHPDLEPAPED